VQYDVCYDIGVSPLISRATLTPNCPPWQGISRCHQRMLAQLRCKLADPQESPQRMYPPANTPSHLATCYWSPLSHTTLLNSPLSLARLHSSPIPSACGGIQVCKQSSASSLVEQPSAASRMGTASA
jgi:hypothetical protein